MSPLAPPIPEGTVIASEKRMIIVRSPPRSIEGSYSRLNSVEIESTPRYKVYNFFAITKQMDWKRLNGSQGLRSNVSPFDAFVETLQFLYKKFFFKYTANRYTRRVLNHYVSGGSVCVSDGERASHDAGKGITI